ncbi:hypothetical protein [Macellibacteroides fermentans]|uniref:hypothetical protein n=1 Tax=Macellibacteroides fermentans TaxID=879969 RepID=UPI00406CA20F
MVTKTIRITEGQEKFLLSNYKNVSEGISDCINKSMIPSEGEELLKLLKAYSLNELKGKFTPNEWKFFADSLNGTMVDGMFRCNVGALVAHCEDSERFEGTASRWEVSVPDLTEKINKLGGAQVEALYTRVESFWDNPKDLEEWSVF